MNERFNQRISKIAGENGPNADELARLHVELEALRKNQHASPHTRDSEQIARIENEIRALGGGIPEYPE